MTKDLASDWRDDLWSGHASLFDRSAPFATRIGSLADGWRETVERMCDRLAGAVASEADGHVRITRVENDRGAMQVDHRATSPRPEFAAEIAEIVALSCARAACSCETCGAVARRYRFHGRTVAACPGHMPRGAIEIPHNWPTIKLTRGFVGGRSLVVGCELYDRERDRFVAVSPADLGLADYP